MPSADPNSAPEAILQMQIGEALPFQFTSTAWEPAGSHDFVVYLTPLNAHTRSVAQAIIDASTFVKEPGVTVTLKQGVQSFCLAQEQTAAVVSKFSRQIVGAGADSDGSVTVDVLKGSSITDSAIIAASHVPGYQAEPLIVRGVAPFSY